MAKDRAKKSKFRLPKYVVVKNNEWHVRRAFPTGERNAAGKIIYEQFTRRCLPETEERAREISEAMEREYRRGDSPEELTDEITFGAFFREYLDRKRARLSPNTYALLSTIGTRHIEPSKLARVALVDVDPLRDVQAFYDQLPLSPAYIRKIHKTVSAAFNQAIKWKLVTDNPTHGAILPKLPFTEVDHFDEAEARAIVKASRSAGDFRFLVLEFALETGMRPEEYLATRWSDVDLGRGTVSVTRVVVFTTKAGFVFDKVKTASSRRTVRISKQLVARLEDYRVWQNGQLAALQARSERDPLLSHMKSRGVNYRKRQTAIAEARGALANLRKFDLVFPTETGTPKNRINVNGREFRYLLGIAKVERRGHSLYSLRHTCATLMLLAGEHVKVVSERLGHADIATTLNTYAHVLPSMQDASTSKLAELLY